MAPAAKFRYELLPRRWNLVAMIALLLVAAALLGLAAARPSLPAGDDLPLNETRVALAAEKIDLNTASRASLRRLPGLGEATIDAIVQTRRQRPGCFRTPADVAAIRIPLANGTQRRISASTVERILPHLTLSPAPAPSPEDDL